MAPATSARDLLFCSFLLVVVNTIFGGYSVFTSAVLKGATLNPVVYAFLRDVFGSIVLLAAGWVTEARRPAGDRHFWPDRADTGHFTLLGLFMVWGAQGMSAMAIANLTPVFFSMTQPAMPVVTLCMSWAMGLEPFRRAEWTTWGKLAGVTVTITGATSMVALSSASAGSDVRTQSKNFGLGLMYNFLQIVLGGAYTPAQKPLLSRYRPLVAAAWGYTFGTGLLLLSVLTTATDAADWQITPLGAAGIAYASLLSSATAYGLMAYVNSRTNPALIATFMPMQSVAGALLGWAILGQSMELPTYAGGGAVMAGQLMVVYCRWREAAAHAGDKDDDLSVAGGVEDEKAVAAGKARLLGGYDHRDDGETGVALVGAGAGAAPGGAPWREPLR